MKRLCIAALGSVALVGTAMAEDKDSQWSGEAELGFVSTSGNTETQTLKAKGKAVNERDSWKHELTLDALNTEDSKVRTAERYNLAGKSSYDITVHDYGFGNISYEDDRFSGYEYRASLTAGYGRHVLTADPVKLDLEAGVGGRKSKPDNGNTDNEAILRLAGFLDWKISDTSKLTEDLTSEIGDDVTISKSETGLKTQINSTLAMKISYMVKYTSKVPVGIEKVDRETAVTLVYGF